VKNIIKFHFNYIVADCADSLAINAAIQLFGAQYMCSRESEIAEAKSCGADPRNRPVDRAERLDDSRRYLRSNTKFRVRHRGGTQKLRRFISRIIEARTNLLNVKSLG